MPRQTLPRAAALGNCPISVLLVAGEHSFPEQVKLRSIKHLVLQKFQLFGMLFRSPLLHGRKRAAWAVASCQRRNSAKSLPLQAKQRTFYFFLAVALLASTESNFSTAARVSSEQVSSKAIA
jgi:hypothetical protein